MITGLLAAMAIAGCEREVWPANQGEMVDLFEEKKSTFEDLEREMTADGLRRMSPAVFSQMETNPTIAPLPSAQGEKYLDLLAEADMFVSVTRHTNATEFELLIESDGPRLYLTYFVHILSGDPPPACSIEMDQQACGQCGVGLGRDWALIYTWFPADPDEEARLC